MTDLGGNLHWRTERWRYSGKTEMRCHTLPHRRGFIFLLFSFILPIPPFHLITSCLLLTHHPKKKAPKCRSFIGFLLFCFTFFSTSAPNHILVSHSFFFSRRKAKTPPENLIIFKKKTNTPSLGEKIKRE